VRIALFAFGLAVAPISLAETLAVTADAGIGATDNITRVPNNPTYESIASVGLGLKLKQSDARLDANVDGDFSYLDYLKHTYGNEVVGRLDGVVKFIVLPERLVWVLQNNFGQVQIDPFAAVTPANRENMNYASTGPDITFHFASRMFAQISGRYSDTRYQVSDLDSHRVFGGAAFGRALSGKSNVSLNVNSERFNFIDTVANADYDRRSAFLHYDGVTGRTSLMFNAGGSQVRVRSRNINGSLMQVSAKRVISDAATLTIEAGTQLTDAGDSFRSLQPGVVGGIPVGPATTTAEPFKRTYAEASWSYVRHRTTIDAATRWSKDQFDFNTQLDVKRTGAQLSVDRRIRRYLSMRLIGDYQKEDYPVTSFSNRTWRAGGEVSIAIGKVTTLKLDYDHYNRSATPANTSFKESRAFVRISYQPAIR